MTTDPATDPFGQLAQIDRDRQARAQDAERERDFASLKQRYSTADSIAKSTAYAPPRPAADPLRGVSERPPKILTGPPHSMQISGPLALLAEVAEHSRVLHAEVHALVTALTGETADDRLARQLAQPVNRPAGALPRVAQLATEIDVVQSDIARLVEHMRSVLP